MLVPASLAMLRSEVASTPLSAKRSRAASRIRGRMSVRGRGIGRALLAEAEARAQARGCVKLTLEVLESNARARGLYYSHGFRDFELAGVVRRTLFLSKPLAHPP